MSYETVFIESLLRLGKDVPVKNRYARTEIGIRIRATERAEVQAAYAVSMPNQHFDRMAFDVVSCDGRFWRPILGEWTWREGHPEGEKALKVLSSTARDNPFGHFAIAGVSRIQTDDLPVRNDDTPQRREVEAKLAAIADADVMLIDGVAHRRCHEPTWIVRPVDGWQKYVLVQADVQSPGRLSDAVWFGADRLDLAMAFAETMAARMQWEVLGPRGGIEMTGIARPEFDDRSFADARLENIWSRRNIVLAGLDRIKGSTEVIEAMFASPPGSSEAVKAAETLRGLALDVDCPGPEIRTMLDRSALPAEHLSFLRHASILRRADENELAALLATGL